MRRGTRYRSPEYGEPCIRSYTWRGLGAEVDPDAIAHEARRASLMYVAAMRGTLLEFLANEQAGQPRLQPA